MQLRIAQLLRQGASAGCICLLALGQPPIAFASTGIVGAAITEVPVEWIAEYDLRRRQLAAAENTGDEQGVIRAALEFADAARFLNRWDEAIRNYQPVRDIPLERLPSNAPDRIRANVGLAVAYYGRGDLDLARQRAKDAIPPLLDLANTLDVTRMALSLGLQLAKDDELDDAEALLRYVYHFDARSAEVTDTQQSQPQVTVLHSRAAVGLARVRYHRHKFSEAWLLLAEGIHTMQTLGSTPFGDAAQERQLAAELYLDSQRFVDAEKSIREALAFWDHVPQALRTDDIGCWDTLGDVYQASGDQSRANAAFATALNLRRKRSGENHWQTAWLEYKLGGTLVNQEDYPSAAPLLQSSLKWFTTRLGAGDVYTARAANLLGRLYYNNHRLSDADPLLTLATQVLRTHLEAIDLASAAVQLGELRRYQGRNVEAMDSLDLAWTIYSSTPTPNTWSVRSAALLGLVKYEAGDRTSAEPLLQNAFEHRWQGIVDDRTLVAYLLAHIKRDRDATADIGPYRAELAFVCDQHPSSILAFACATSKLRP